MSTEQLTGLQLAVTLLAQIGNDDSDRAIAAVHAAADERDELRAKYDELLVALHGIGRALGLAEGDRSPYSVTCGVLERVNRLAEIEAQEPLFYYRPIKGGSMYEGPLYARPVPAQAVPMSDERIDAIAELVIKGMPDGILGFMRTWGYQQFARALLGVCAGHYRAQAVPESVDGLVSVLCYDEVLTFTFCDEDAADKFASRFDPSVDSAAAPEHGA